MEDHDDPEAVRSDAALFAAIADGLRVVLVHLDRDERYRRAVRSCRERYGRGGPAASGADRAAPVEKHGGPWPARPGRPWAARA